MFIDMHIHEKTYSSDSSMLLDDIVEQAKKLGLDGICITDHESNSLKETASQTAKDKNFLIFVGAEILTYEGDVIIFGLDNIPQEKMHAKDLVALVNNQGGVAISAHPYRQNGRGMGDEIKKTPGLSAVEGLNGSTPPELNMKAYDSAREVGLPLVGSSDAHWISQLGKYATYFEDDIATEYDLIQAIKSGRIEPVYYSEGSYHKLT